MLNNVCYATVYVTDFEKAVNFYEKTLGMPLRFRDDGFGYASFQTEGASLAVARVDPGDASMKGLVGRHTGIGIGVADIQATYEALKERGVTFRQPPQRFPWGGTLALLADPEGNVLTLDEIREG